MGVYCRGILGGKPAHWGSAGAVDCVGYIGYIGYITPQGGRSAGGRIHHWQHLATPPTELQQNGRQCDSITAHYLYMTSHYFYVNAIALLRIIRAILILYNII